jgi:hypothetical protein
MWLPVGPDRLGSRSLGYFSTHLGLSEYFPAPDQAIRFTRDNQRLDASPALASARILHCIDRFYTLAALAALYPRAYTKIVPTQLLSDHFPIRLHLFTRQQPHRIPFRMNLVHLQDPKLQQLVQEDWLLAECHSTQGYTFDRLSRCLARATTLVRDWTFHKAQQSKSFKMQKEAKLLHLRTQLQLEPMDLITQTHLAKTQSDIHDLEIQAALQAQATLRASWILDGDSCSKRFF